MKFQDHWLTLWMWSSGGTVVICSYCNEQRIWWQLAMMASHIMFPSARIMSHAHQTIIAAVMCRQAARPQLDSWLHTLHHVTNTGDPVSVSPCDNIRDYLSIVPISISHITVWSVNNQYTSLRPCRCHNNQLIPSTLVPCHLVTMCPGHVIITNTQLRPL